MYQQQKRAKPRRSRSSYKYYYDYQICLRIGEYEMKMLKMMAERWNVSISEAVRRAIVYTFSKFITRSESISEEDLKIALRVALEGIANVS